MHERLSFLLKLILIILLFIAPILEAQEIPTPKQFFGFKMGTDGELARWPKIVEYFHLLAENSDRVIVKTLGKSTEGNPFILSIFSAPENLAQLEKYRKISKKLADPRGLSDSEIEKLIAEGKYVSVQSYSLHATEVGGINCTPELAYELATSKNPTTQKILENTILLLIPSFNPDGANMVTDWFYKYKDTEFNNTKLPYLYQKYTGHDNNRDSYQLTQKESQMYAKVVYRDWAPQSFVDHHHFGSYGARFYIPPYLDPIHPNVNPLVWREHQLYGAHMAVALENDGKSGIETGAPFTGWWQASFHMSANYHNICGMLTESANAKWADPIYILSDQLSGTRGRPEYKPQMTMPRLWEGGWWRLCDIVEQKIIASKAVLELGTRYRETMLRNMVLKAKENIRQGKNEPPYAFIIPKNQHDFLTAIKLVKTFQLNGVEIHKLNQTYRVGSEIFDEGSYVISCAQPLRAFVVSFLEQINYPDNYWTRSHGTGVPLRPYDLSGYSVSEHMGVDAFPINQPLRNISMKKVEEFVEPPKGTVEGDGANGFVLEHKYNDGFNAINKLLENKVEACWTKNAFTDEGKLYPPGSMIVKGDAELKLKLNQLAEELGLDFYNLENKFSGKAWKLKKPRLGLYKRFAGGNMDEGWTNWLLQDFDFSFKSLHNQDIKDKKLTKKYDVIIIPSDSYKRIVNGDTTKKTPVEFRNGISKDGIKNIKTFVENGGTMITLNQAYDFAKQVFELPLRNTISDVPSKEFYCPGSTVKITVDTSHPLGYGMPADALALFRYSPALSVSAGDFNDRVSVPVRYAVENILKSGWLIGEKYLSEKPAVIEFKVKKGKVIILAFPAQHRAQMHGTFKFLFNAIYYGAAEEVEM